MNTPNNLDRIEHWRDWASWSSTKIPPADPGRPFRMIEFAVRAFERFRNLDTVQVLSYTPLSLSAQQITGGAHRPV